MNALRTPSLILAVLVLLAAALFSSNFNVSVTPKAVPSVQAASYQPLETVETTSEAGPSPEFIIEELAPGWMMITVGDYISGDYSWEGKALASGIRQLDREGWLIRQIVPLVKTYSGSSGSHTHALFVQVQKKGL